MDNRREIVKKVIVRHCGRPDIVEEDSLFMSLGLSSLETMFLIVDIENSLDIALDYSELRRVRSVKDLLDIVEQTG